MSNSLPPLPPNDGQFQFPIWKWFNDLRSRFAELASRVTKLETGDGSVSVENENAAVTVFPLTEVILYSTPGTYQYTYPYDCDVVANVIGAGGSGGRGRGAGAIGTGGGAGERRVVRFRATAGESSTIIIGAGGQASVSTSTIDGVNGEPSEFQHLSKGVFIVSDSGKGGKGDTGTVPGGAGGNAGQGGDVAYSGGAGGEVSGGSGQRATGGGAVAITTGNFDAAAVSTAGAAGDGASAVQERGAFFIPMSALYSTGGVGVTSGNGGDGGDYSGGGGAVNAGNGGNGGTGAGGGGAASSQATSIRAGHGGDGAVIIWHSGPIS